MQISHLLGCLTDDLQIWLNFTSRFEVRIFVGLFLHEQPQGPLRIVPLADQTSTFEPLKYT